jgi:hypothetical protein
VVQAQFEWLFLLWLSEKKPVGLAQASIADRESPRRRAPNLRVTDRFIVAVCSLFIRRARLVRSAIILRPSTILNFHQNLVKLKYRLLFCPKRRAKPGPKGPTQDLIHAVRRIEMAQSRLGMSAYRCTDQLGVWGPY